MREAWADLNGLSVSSVYCDDERALEALIDGRRKELVRSVDSLRGLKASVFDHAAFFSARGNARSVVAVVTAPYIGTVRRSLGSTAALNRRAYDIARDLGLFVRVGHPADTIHLSARPASPTIPIVWWNLDRIDIDVPMIDDPYPRYA